MGRASLGDTTISRVPKRGNAGNARLNFFSLSLSFFFFSYFFFVIGDVLNLSMITNATIRLSPFVLIYFITFGCIICNNSKFYIFYGRLSINELQLFLHK